MRIARRMLLAGLALVLTAAPAYAGGVTLSGAGSTFIEPLMTKWAGDYGKVDRNVQINYQGIGSGGGIQQFIAGTVDFGASDAPLKPDERGAAERAGGPALQIPLALGAVVVTYNLPGVKELKLDGPALAAIFLGKIKRWNDRAIARANPGVKLPGDPITLVHRADSSGTSFTFTSYLDQVSPEWHSKVGADKNPSWPTGVGGQGNDGVAAAVKQTKGAVGYNEIAYALQNRIPFATLQNVRHKWVKPTLDAVSRAGGIAAFPPDLKFSLVNSGALGAYPIVGVTWVLAYQSQRDRAKGQALVQFLDWVLTKGQAGAPGLNYGPLPKSLAAAALKAVGSIRVG